MANHGAIIYGPTWPPRWSGAAARVGLRGLLAGRQLGAPRALDEERAARGGRGGDGARLRRARGARRMSRAMRAIAMGVHVLDVLLARWTRSPRGRAASSWRRSASRPRAAGGHRAHAGEARRRLAAPARWARRGRGHAAVPARARRHGHLAAGAPRRRADLRQRAADPPQRRPPGLPRDRRQRDLRPGRRSLGRDRRGHPPAPRRAGVHGRRGGGADPRRAPASSGVVTSADILAPGRPGLLDWIAPALPSLDYLLPNASRCWRSPARTTWWRAARG